MGDEEPGGTHDAREDDRRQQDLNDAYDALEGAIRADVAAGRQPLIVCANAANLMMALLIYVIYNNLLSIMQAWLAQGKLSPMVGLWPVHVFFLVLTFYMFYRRLFLLPMIPRLWFK